MGGRGRLPGDKKTGGLNLTIYFYAVLSLIMYGVTPPLPHCTLIDWGLIIDWDTLPLRRLYTVSFGRF